jgi:class 3 adenylate cyclase/tetratricopeptide (TPR) repeat protein
MPYLPTQVLERIRQGRRGVFSEHRLVTIMFAKFGGLNFDLDPAVGQVLQTYFTMMRDCVLRYGGRLNEVDIVADGGTLVVFFGAPTAHEDDELRAVACAREMQQTVADVRAAAGVAAERLRQCIGISSGSVFVGEVGAPVRRTYTAVGDEVNLAARIMNMARWGEVVVTSWVQKRSSGHFDFRSMGGTKLKGKLEPVPLFALVGRREAQAADGLLNLLLGHQEIIGRAAELAILEAVLERAWRGESQLVLLSGEAGVGKSFLIGSLSQRWSDLGGQVCAVDCHRQGNVAPYDLWTDVLSSVFGLSKMDAPDRQQEKIEHSLSLLSPSLAARSGFFIGVMGVGTSQGAVRSAAMSGEITASLCRHIADLLRAVARQQGLLLVLENLHDVDGASLDLFNGMLPQLQGIPLMICAAHRPSDSLRIDSDAVTATNLVLDALSDADTLTLANQLLADRGLSTDLAPQLVEQVRGNPFYLREMIDTLRNLVDPETALVQRQVVPESISDTILAQLDPLGEDYKLTLRIAAVMGQLFGFAALQVAHPLPVSRQELAVRLAKLERMHIIRLDHFGPDIVYCFRHAITQQVIYASLLSGDRERFHRRVAQALEQVYPLDLETRYSVVADHYARGNVLTKAINYWTVAGQQAVRARAFREALAHYKLAEETLSICYSCRPRCAQGVQLNLMLSRAHVRYQLGQVAEAVQDYEAASLVAGDLVDLGSQGEALYWLAEIAFHQAYFPESQVLILQAAQRFSALDDRDALADVWLLYSRLHDVQGDIENARRYVGRALVLNEDVRDHAGSARCRGWAATIDFATGKRVQVLDVMQRTIELEQRADQPSLLAESSLWLAEALLQQGDWGQALSLSRQSLELSQTSGSILDVADAQRATARVLARIGAYEEASDYLDQAMRLYADANWRIGLAYGYWTSGETLLALGRYEQAFERFHQALSLGRATHIVHIVVLAQLGLGTLAVVNRDFPEGQRLCTEARARARRANLDALVVAARLGLASAYLGRAAWDHAKREALQALDASYRLHCPYDTFRSAAMLGEALRALGQPGRAQTYFAEAHTMILRLANTLPEHYARLFLERGYVRTVLEYVAREGGRVPAIEHSWQLA